MRWLEVVQKDLQRMKFKKRRQKAVDNEEWASVIGRLRLSEGRRAEE